jgi:hypothetical protein
MKHSLFNNDRGTISYFQFYQIRDYEGKKQFDNSVKLIFENEKNEPIDLFNNDLGKWILRCIPEACCDFDLDGLKKPNEFIINRTYGNMLLKDQEILSHRHKIKGGDGPDLVAVLYPYYQMNSGRMIFIDEKDQSTYEGKHYMEYKPIEKNIFVPEPGTLLFHNPYMLHAVEKNNLTIPRISIVFEITFKNNFEGSATNIQTIYK